MSLHSFNGVILEGLPGWDDSTNPNAVVLYHEKMASREFTLIASNAAMKFDPDNGIVVPEGSTLERWSLTVDSGSMTWEFATSSNGVVNTNYILARVIWSNYSVKDLSGTTIMAASTPVPFEYVTADKGWVRAGKAKFPEFPADPEWDRTLFPYGYVFYDATFDGYFLMISPAPAYVSTEISVESIRISGFRVSKHMKSYDKPYWDTFMEPATDDPLAVVSYADMVWHSVINDQDGNAYYAASADPSPSSTFDFNSWLYGFALGLSGENLPFGVRKDILDDEWPITWDYPAILDNNRIEMTDSGCAVKVSSLVPQEADYERLVVEITENGVTSMLKFAELFMKQTNGDILSFEDDAKTLDFSCYVVRKEGEMAGLTFPTRGIYPGYLYSDISAKKFTMRMTEAG